MGDSKLVANTARRRPPNAGKGRPKGSQNKTTVAVKQALNDAFDELGGVAALVRWGKASPGEFYKIWVRMLPTEVSGPDGGPIEVASLVDELSRLSPEERAGLRKLATE